jgi:4-hydroxybenzoate polyprenyltransferase
MKNTGNMSANLINQLRLSNPWKYKAPLLICWPYLLIMFTRTYPMLALENMLLAYSTLFGIAGLGYFINDWADIRSDKAAGKKNKVGELKTGSRLLILVALLCFAFLPWIKLPVNIYSWILIGTEIFLFLIYSLPPFRLKEKGFLGILTDALYAYLVPSLLASLTFFLIMDGGYPGFEKFLVVLSAWLLIVGVRGILLHQMLDYQNDMNSNITTFITRHGTRSGEKILNILIPVEGLLMLLFFVFIVEDFYLIIPGYFVFCLYALYQGKKDQQPVRIKDHRKFSNRLFDDFLLDVFPVLILIQLCISNYFYAPLLVLHLVFFRNVVKNILRKFIT